MDEAEINCAELFGMTKAPNKAVYVVILYCCIYEAS